MQISIHTDELLFNIQCRFQELFPYLKLEFLHSAKLTFPPRALSKKQQLISVHPDKQVVQLEEELESICGIPVQVLRKCGQGKHEKVSAPHTTLAHQNKEGRLRTALAPVTEIY
ncbi:hypothetical protein GA0116948_12420 [Chitinophaga costaii]|uniref:Uncharacterized protein n=1 Tax=Chitinophaga costaii TaxID=1335309 RepID=A0A1C4G630_9BACT|nr:hypothetical protein [Chitinophaga costaii]PUZ20097.1 hypothetical protein DCM91_19375 [Chitinophaga costaii]SCC63612.1 hypothetical protein GA0116948_12420 [Chitinophaga costaii]